MAKRKRKSAADAAAWDAFKAAGEAWKEQQSPDYWIDRMLPACEAILKDKSASDGRREAARTLWHDLLALRRGMEERNWRLCVAIAIQIGIQAVSLDLQHIVEARKKQVAAMQNGKAAKHTADVQQFKKEYLDAKQATPRATDKKLARHIALKMKREITPATFNRWKAKAGL